MSQVDLPQTSLPTGPERLVPRPGVILALGLLLVGGAYLMTDPRAALGLQVAGVVLIGASVGAAIWARRRRIRREMRLATVIEIAAHDLACAFVTDADGSILHRNGPADARFQDSMAPTLGYLFGDLFANPGAVMFRSQAKAHALGHATEDIVTRRGHLRLSATRLGDGLFLWRLEDLGRGTGGRGTDALDLPMLTAGPSGTILYMNEAFRRLVGGRRKRLEQIFEDMPITSGRLHKVRAAAGPVASLVAEVSGQGGRREIYLLPGESAPDQRMTDWDAVEDLPVPLMKVSVNGEILSSNRGARELLEHPMPSGTRLGDLLDGLGRPITDWLREAATGAAGHAPQFLRGTGKRQDIFVQVMLNPVGGGGSGGEQLIAVLNDVTELKTLEAQFVQSQKMQAIGQLAGGVAHDFNNLLTAISGHCDLLLLRHDQGDEDYGDLIQIHQNANRAAALVSQLLAFSRKQNLRPERLDLRNTLADLAHLLNRLVGEKVRLTLNHDPALLPIRADKRQLEQVVMNLVVNARDAMPDGGEILIETENVTLRQPVERDRATIPAGDYVQVRVIDEGCGIPPERKPKVFEPFYTSKRPGEGTGLGLSTAYGIVKQTGGFIFVDSEIGRGTVFTIYMPVYDGPADPAPETVAVADDRPINLAHNADGVILLVEDEAPVRAFASRALRLKGYTVLEAESAEAALDILSDDEVHVDVFVTDVIMPGLDGPSWVRKALVARPDTKVIFMSGYAEDAFADGRSDIPGSSFLPKPFSLNDLTTTVQRLV